ncbi:MAG TPA: hypothetical protein VJT31_16115 [Rugosimonospora sp.]|nr:hypothetical protein [Rugosimonospora sp.]
MRRAVMLLVVGLGLVLSGCTGGSGTPSAASSAPASAPPNALPSTVDSGAPPASAFPEPGPTRTAGGPTAAPPAGTQLVAFGRQGGLAGVADTLVIKANGTFTLVRLRPRALTRSGTLPATDLASLRQTLNGAGFASMPKVQKGDTLDAFTYLVSYQGYQITAQDGAVVSQLRPVITALSGIVAKYGG